MSPAPDPTSPVPVVAYAALWEDTALVERLRASCAANPASAAAPVLSAAATILSLRASIRRAARSTRRPRKS